LLLGIKAYCSDSDSNDDENTSAIAYQQHPPVATHGYPPGMMGMPMQMMAGYQQQEYEQPGEGKQFTGSFFL
jgi:hypothetical protein